MPIIAKGSDGKDFVPAPEGMWNAVCCDVVDLGMRPTAHGDKHKVRVHWELDVVDEDREGPNGERLNHTAVRNYNLTLGKGSHLRVALESWRGQPFTPDELDGFDLEKLIGANCQVLIEHNLGDNGKTYANITKVLKPGKQQPKLTPSPLYIRFQDREKTNGESEGTSNGYSEQVPF